MRPRDAKAELVSRQQILRRERGRRKYMFTVGLDVFSCDHLHTGLASIPPVDAQSVC